MVAPSFLKNSMVEKKKIHQSVYRDRGGLNQPFLPNYLTIVPVSKKKYRCFPSKKFPFTGNRHPACRFPSVNRNSQGGVRPGFPFFLSGAFFTFKPSYMPDYAT